MVGRNDPCVCGSGKKYKKCCGKSQMVDMSAVIGDELDRVMAGFANEGLGRREYGEMEIRFRTWTSVLRDTFDLAMIETLALETYMYVDRKDLWADYLNRQLSKHHRVQVQDVLKSWQEPFWLMGEVVDQKGDDLYLRDGLTGQMYIIDSEESPFKGDWLFGLVMPDSRDGNQRLQGTSGLLFIPKNRSEFVHKLLEELKSFDGDSLALYCLFSEVNHDLQFTPFEEEVVQLVKGYLKSFALDEDTMVPMVRAFLLYVKVNAKKAGAVAAGLVQAAYDFGIIGTNKVTQKELVAYFKVSPGTMNKYRDMVGDFIVRAIKEDEEVPSVAVAEMGTDPRGTERHLWEMVLRASRQEIESEEEFKRMLQGEMNATFEPKGNKERAQALCFEAYEAKSEKERIQLTKKAALLDPKNTDVQLLLAEQETDDLQKEIHFLQSVNTGYRQFDNSFEDGAWAYVLNRPLLRALFSYGAWLMKKGKLDKAIEQFQDLLAMNPKDHQGVKWLLVSAYLHAGKLQEAKKMLVNQDDDSHHKTLIHYFDATILKMGGGASTKVKDHFQTGQSLNPHVAKLMKEGHDPGVFPRNLMLQDGNGDEARLVYWLIYGLMD